MTMQTGIILLAHGSRDPLWKLPIEAVAEAIRARDPQALVVCAYLELSSPELSQAANELIERGARRIRVFPLFFGVGKHAREDLPRLFAELGTAHPELALELLPTAGEQSQITALIAAIALA